MELNLQYMNQIPVLACQKKNIHLIKSLNDVHRALHLKQGCLSWLGFMG